MPVLNTLDSIFEDILGGIDLPLVDDSLALELFGPSEPPINSQSFVVFDDALIDPALLDATPTLPTEIAPADVFLEVSDEDIILFQPLLLPV